MDSSINAFQIFQRASVKLSGTCEKEEAAANVRWLMEAILGFSRIDIGMKKIYPGDTAAMEQFDHALDRISSGEPIQYVLGFAEFLGNQYHVNPSVLIPRPETEELVLQIIKDNPAVKTVLDIGTGSGCIAISLAKALKDVDVLAWDVDRDTLEVAKKNAGRLEVSVEFQQVDVLDEWPKKDVMVGTLDLIVANPPYITEREKGEMRTNVLAHEPSKALFVPDSDPLLFYREIAKKGKPHFSEGGKLYFEINEYFGAEVVSLLETLGYADVRLNKDFQQKPRMVQAVWPG